uniref:Uncharacterized protein n=1 Tax=Anguilla anguilla TaxID=7936 RepID=A0A0E9T924_ANGAN
MNLGCILSAENIKIVVKRVIHSSMSNTIECVHCGLHFYQSGQSRFTMKQKVKEHSMLI